MKSLTLLIMTIGLLGAKSEKDIDEYSTNPTQCLLSMSVKEYFYQNITDTIQLVLSFKSNCAPFRFPIYFIIPSEKWYYFGIGSGAHPKKVELYLMRKNYTIDFIKREEQPYGKKLNFTKFVYTHFKINPGNYPNQKYRVHDFNYFLMQNKDGHYIFEKNVIENFWNTKNPVYCTSSGLATLVCDIPLIE